MSTKSKISEIVIRCWSDESFKSKFKSDPRSIFNEYGISLNDVKNVTIVENNATDAYFIIPAKPEAINLSEADLKSLVERMVAEQLVLPTILGQ
jgi:hypothetical protein